MSQSYTCAPSPLPHGMAEIDIATLRPPFSPRHEPCDQSHALALAERFDDLPPIVVHRETLRVIDGVHRVLAATMLGLPRVRATLFSGTDAEAYVEAVRLNIAHGKPLTMGERRDAATRVLHDHPEWSDRRIAQSCGLSAKTVARARRRATDVLPQSSARRGKDGRARPTDPGSVRHRVADILRGTPSRSLRDVASTVGTSQATVLDVRRRLERGESPVPPDRSRRAAPDARLEEPSEGGAPGPGWGDDPAFSSSAEARRFVEWFERTEVSVTDGHLGAVPLGRVYAVADECRRRAAAWRGFAAALERRARRGPPGDSAESS